MRKHDLGLDDSPGKQQKLAGENQGHLAQAHFLITPLYNLQQLLNTKVGGRPHKQNSFWFWRPLKITDIGTSSFCFRKIISHLNDSIIYFLDV